MCLCVCVRVFIILENAFEKRKELIIDDAVVADDNLKTFLYEIKRSLSFGLSLSHSVSLPLLYAISLDIYASMRCI